MEFQHLAEPRIVSVDLKSLMDVHPSNNLHTCKMEHKYDSENEIVQL